MEALAMGQTGTIRGIEAGLWCILPDQLVWGGTIPRSCEADRMFLPDGLQEGLRGSRIVKVVPWPTSEVNESCPWCLS